ncbi:MAG: cytochrome c [Rhodospirillaceae bacterium]|nr:cytochrome c [Rhodospirillaceae bacterium]
MMRSIFAFVAATALAATAARAADPVRGEDLARQCFACHGKDGNAPSPINPKIGGQHERYLVLAMNEYKEGKRKESLMRGAVLQLSDDEIKDIAAYYARQRAFTEAPPPKGGPAQAAAGPGGPGAGGPGGPGPGSLGNMRVDKVERTALYLSLLSAAKDATAAAKPLDAKACDGLTGAASGKDADNDGLDDAYDAAPTNAAEFVHDKNADGSFEICSIQQLQAVVSLGTGEGKASPLSLDARLKRNYQLAADLDASSVANFTPIGSCGPEDNCMIARGKYGYAGTLDGRGRVIRNLKISLPQRGGVGLIGVLGESGMVMNVKLENTTIEGRSGTGMAVGANMGTVYNVHAQGVVNAGLAVGGLVGGNSGLVAASSARGELNAQQAAGGLVGDMTGAVYDSVAEVNVKGTRGLGGLVGLSTFGTILGSTARGAVTGTNDLGGLVGMNTDASVTNSSATGTVTGEANNIGGLVGFNSLSMIRNSYATGDVTGTDSVGGLVGRNNGLIRRSYSSGTVAGQTKTGGIAGETVQGEEKASFAKATAKTAGTPSDLAVFDIDKSGWAPKQPPVQDFLDYYCDRNLNGFIEPAERKPDNYVWAPGALPRLRCSADTKG